jgi:hypothetical protein
MSAKRKESRQERRSIQILEAAGYRCSRTAGGLAIWNLIAMGTRDTVLLLVESRPPESGRSRGHAEFLCTCELSKRTCGGASTLQPRISRCERLSSIVGMVP